MPPSTWPRGTKITSPREFAAEMTTVEGSVYTMRSVVSSLAMTVEMMSQQSTVLSFFHHISVCPGLEGYAQATIPSNGLHANPLQV